MAQRELSKSGDPYTGLMLAEVRPARLVEELIPCLRLIQNHFFFKKKDYNLNVRQKHLEGQKHNHANDGLSTSDAHTKNKYMHADLALCLMFMLFKGLNWSLLLPSLTFPPV